MAFTPLNIKGIKRILGGISNLPVDHCPTVIDLGYTKDNMLLQEYTIWFVYPKNKPAFCIKGRRKEVDKYLKDNDYQQSICYCLNYSQMGRQHIKNGYWCSPNGELMIRKMSKIRRKSNPTERPKTRNIFGIFNARTNERLLVCRRMPRKYLPIYDKAFE